MFCHRKMIIDSIMTLLKASHALFITMNSQVKWGFLRTSNFTTFIILNYLKIETMESFSFFHVCMLLLRAPNLDLKTCFQALTILLPNCMALSKFLKPF